MNRRTLLVIALGGVFGALARLLIVESFPDDGSRWAVLLANVAGCLVLGWAATRLLQTPPDTADPNDRRWMLALTSGFCGSLTTFSSFVVESAESLRSGSAVSGVGYLAVSIAFGAAAMWAGHRVAAS